MTPTVEERNALINLLNTKLKDEFDYVSLKSAINIADFLIAHGVSVKKEI